MKIELLILLITMVILKACQPSNKSNQIKSPPETNIINTTEEKTTKSLPKVTTTIADIMGQFEPNNHLDFIQINSTYTTKENIYLRREALDAFKRMHAAAEKDGVHLTIRSATRNFNYQKGIWERKWTGETKIENGQIDASTAYTSDINRAQAILKYSSMPGTSRHHWGTDIDINQFENSYFESGQGLVEFKWLEQHAAEYGYCRPYTTKGQNRPHGYEEEKWHWSYMPIAGPLLNFAEIHLKDEMIKGFKGAEVAPQLHVTDRYILGINPRCK